MERVTIKKNLEELYLRYGYELHKITDEYCVFLLKQGMYYGADIILLKNEVPQIESIKNDLSSAGYGVKIRTFVSLPILEDELFNGFFNVKSILARLQRRYSDFSVKQVKNFGSNATYKYINAPYESYDNDVDDSNDIVANILNQLNKQGAHLIIVEAAAGFGKTCTAFEIINELTKKDQTKAPFLTELAQNRQAKIFKYVLLSEIDSEYRNSVNSELVIHNIKQGRIPLIVDGFDELLGEAQDKGSNLRDFEQVETMLSTISSLLVNNAKIILTSRKTAIFSGNEFQSWVESCDRDFNVTRYSISEPSINDWLDQPKLELIKNKNLPIKHIANPVLLSYFRCLPIDEFTNLISKPEKIVDQYFEALLLREQTRQDLAIPVLGQLKILRGLSKVFIEYNINAEYRDFVKECLIDYNRDVLIEYSKSYPQKITVDELAEKLTNHALLDRIGSKENIIGFVNEFIFGTLIGEACIEDPNICNKHFAQNLAELAITAFQFQSRDKRESLWLALNNLEISAGQFNLIKDIKLREGVFTQFLAQNFTSITIEDIIFSEGEFNNCTFSEVVFKKCFFDFTLFTNTTFYGCKFLNCENVPIDTSQEINNTNSFFVCTDYDSGFINKIKDSTQKPLIKDSTPPLNLRSTILVSFFKKDGKTPRMRLISSFQQDFDKKVDLDVVFNEIRTLEKQGLIKTNGNKSHISEEGISFYNKSYRNSHATV